MILFAGNDGTIIKSVPSNVYQGAANANNIYLIAPFASNLTVTVAFKLPNGVIIPPDAMSLMGEIEGVTNEKTGKPYVGWQYALPNSITEYFGTVTAQFYFYSAENGVVLASSSTSFPVDKGVPAVLPNTPSPDVYQKILNNLTLLQQQLNNGAFAARAMYAWNSTYTYGAGEIVFYPEHGEYGVFVKSLVTENKSLPYVNGELNSENWQLEVDFDKINEVLDMQPIFEEALTGAQTAAAAAKMSETNAAGYANAAQQSQESAAGSEAQAAQSAENAKVTADRLLTLTDYISDVKDGTQAVAKALEAESADNAINDEYGENIAGQFLDINSKIPSTASASNKLADQAFVNSSINNMSAFYITYTQGSSTESGKAFPTHASLMSATTFYSGGKPRVPTQNDYATVLADETQPKGVDGSYPTTRYFYQTNTAGGTYPDGQWEFQYVVNNTSLTQAQVDAVNSGITAAKIASMDAATAAKYTKPSSGIPESDLSAAVQGKLDAISDGNFPGPISAPSASITGDLVVNGDQYVIGNLTGINGGRGYVQIAKITIKGYYSNTPLCIEISNRNSLLSKKIFIQYNSENNDTPGLYSFRSIGSTDLKAYISQDTNNKSVWYLIVKKSEDYDSIQVLDYRHAPFGDIVVEWTNELLTDLPESYTECGDWYALKTEIPTQASQVNAVPSYGIGNTGNSRNYYMFARMPSSNPDGEHGLTLLVSGGGNYGGQKYGVWLLEITNRGSNPTMIVTTISANDGGTVTFGYRTNGNYFEFGMCTTEWRSSIRIAVLKNINGETGTFYDASTRPLGWTETTNLVGLRQYTHNIRLTFPSGSCSFMFNDSRSGEHTWSSLREKFGNQGIPCSGYQINNTSNTRRLIYAVTFSSQTQNYIDVYGFDLTSYILEKLTFEGTITDTVS